MIVELPAVQLKVTSTLELFHPLADGVGEIVAEIDGGVPTGVVTRNC